jgi:DnaJ-class molecular chaperone
VGASVEEIVAAYHQMARMYHPDRLAHLAPEFVALAEERMKEINAAYEQLKKRV